MKLYPSSTQNNKVENLKSQSDEKHVLLSPSRCQRLYRTPLINLSINQH